MSDETTVAETECYRGGVEKDKVEFCDEEVVGEKDEARIPTKSDDAQMTMTLQSTCNLHLTQQLIDKASSFTWTHEQYYNSSIQACRLS